jgi:hypothetical protein
MRTCAPASTGLGQTCNRAATTGTTTGAADAYGRVAYQTSNDGELLKTTCGVASSARASDGREPWPGVSEITSPFQVPALRVA